MEQSDSKAPVVGIDKKIPLIEKIMYPGLTGFGTFYGMFINTWLLFFYTDILKIDAAFVGVMFLVVRIIDAIVTPAFGMYCDRHNTRLGKYKPWLIGLSMASAIGTFVIFIPVHLGTAGNMIFATVTYTVSSIVSSMGQGPGAGLSVAMTKRQDDRISMGIYSYVWIVIFAALGQIGSLPLINLLGHGSQGTGMQNLMLIAAIIGIIFDAVLIKVLKERFINENAKTEKFNLIEAFKPVVKNKYAIINLVLILYLNLVNAVRTTVGIYYYKYYFHDENMMVTIGAITMIPMFLGLVLSPPITKKIGVKNVMMMNVVASIITSAAVFFVPGTDIGKIEFIVLFSLGTLFLGIAQPASGVIGPNSIDYGEWKFGVNSGGLIGSLGGFMQTVANAIGGAVTAGILAFVGYVPNVAQSVTSLTGIKFMMSLLPAIFAFTGFALVKWDMTEAKSKQIAKELNERRIAAEKAAEGLAENPAKTASESAT